MLSDEHQGRREPGGVSSDDAGAAPYHRSGDVLSSRTEAELAVKLADLGFKHWAVISRNRFGFWVPRGSPPPGGPRHYHMRSLARIDPTLDPSARGLLSWEAVFRAHRLDGAARRFFAEMEPYAPPTATAMAWLSAQWLRTSAPACLLVVGGDLQALERDLPTLAALAARLVRER